jgi:cobalt-zinc-cadmium efflux system membrane fusion protein
MPEAATQLLGNLAPRFYATADSLQGVLVFSDARHLSDPVLFLAEPANNAAVGGAHVSAEVISPKQRKLEVTTGTTAGSYVIHGVDPDSTSSISIEATAGELADILTFDNVIVPHTRTEADATPISSIRKKLQILGVPYYLEISLLAIACLLMLANVLVLITWFTRERRIKKGVPPAAMLVAAALLSYSNFAGAHAGDEHSAVALTASAVQSGAGARHFVSIDTQFQADLRTTTAAEIKIPMSFRTLGEVVVRPDREADVTPPAEGKLLPPNGPDGEIPIAGTTVTKGQTLVVLEQIIPATERVTLTNDRSQIEADLASAQQELAVASREKDRAEKLTNVISSKELERARADLKIAQERVDGLQKRLTTLTAALQGSSASVREIQIKSPITGFIAESHATNGEYVPTSKKLFTLVNLDEVFVLADIFESDIAKVTKATSARITVEAYPNLSFHGTLQSFGQQIDPEKRTLRGQFNVENPEHLLRGGMFANVEIQSDEQQSALVIPKQAVITENGVRQVFKKLSPELFVAVPVAVSAYRDEYAVIAEGLKAGDCVAVNGLYQIRMAPVVGEGK